MNGGGRRWKPHDELLVYFYGFVRRSSNGVFVNSFKIRGIEIFGKGGGYNFGSKALREPRVMILKRQPFLEARAAYKDLKNLLAPRTARGKDDALSCEFVDSRNM